VVMLRSLEGFQSIQWDREALGNKQLLFNGASYPFKSINCSKLMKRSRGSTGWDSSGSDNPWRRIGEVASEFFHAAVWWGRVLQLRRMAL
jgi:hypothetical protein